MMENCRYCSRTTDIAEIVTDLEVSTLYITKDQTYIGRCILALKEHKTEVFQLSADEIDAVPTLQRWNSPNRALPGRAFAVPGMSPADAPV
jgi:diadenosine tetraphosphate (Ap4A) HIT family hydrolase